MDAAGDGADHGLIFVVADHHIFFNGAVADGNIESRGAAGEAVVGQVGADQAGFQGAGTRLQGHIINADGLAGQAHALQVIHQAVARDLFAVDIQVFDGRALDIAQ